MSVGLDSCCIVDYDVILRLFPYYDEIREYFKQYKIIDKEELVKFIQENYRSSKTYEQFVGVIKEERLKTIIMDQALKKHEVLEKVVERYRQDGIKCCDLIEYIGTYPDRWPVPLEEEKNPRLEALLNQYDIIVRYYAYDDLDKMQIEGDDINRLIQTVDRDLAHIKEIGERAKTPQEYLKTKESYEPLLDYVQKDLEFPLSKAQQKGKSRREEGKRYLRIQHGENII